MQKRLEQLQVFEALSFAGGLVVATLVFAFFYHLLGWLLRDKPLAFVAALFMSFFSLLNIQRETLKRLKERT
jgi:hypothetical protein